MLVLSFLAPTLDYAYYRDRSLGLSNVGAGSIAAAQAKQEIRQSMVRIALILTGCAASALAVAGAVLPGLPTTPFLLVALWAFARSSDALYGWLQRVPLLQTALGEARRFEEKRAVHPAVKLTAVSVAWGSVLLTALTTGVSPVPVSLVTLAAVAGSLFMWWVPTDRT